MTIASRITAWLLLAVGSVTCGVLVLAIANGEAFLIAMIALLALLMAGVLRSARNSEGSAYSPSVLFFGFAMLHVVVGYLAANPTSIYLAKPGGSLYQNFDLAFLIIAAGLASMMLGYIWANRSKTAAQEDAIVNWLSRVPEDRIARRALVLCSIALPLLAVTFWQLESVPLFSANPGQERYARLFQQEYRTAVWTQNRCIDILQGVSPLLLLISLRRRLRNLYRALAFTSVFGVVCIVRRAPLVSIIFTLVLLALSGKRLGLLILFAPVFLLAYVLSQFLFMDVSTFGGPSILDLYGQALPEVRDLAWVLSGTSDYFWGGTFLYALIPLPSFATEFQQNLMLRNITLEAIGFPLEAAHGGPRISFAGECYLNFGFAGVITLGFAYGWICAFTGRALHRARKLEAGLPAEFLIASCWVLLMFWLYLGGTNAAGVIRFELIVLAILYVPLRRVAISPPLPPPTPASAPPSASHTRA